MDKRVVDPVALEILVSEYKEGKTCKELAKKYESTEKKIHTILKNAGVTFRPPGNRALDPEKAKQVVVMYVAGMPIKVITRRLQVSEGAVYAQLKKNKIPYRRGEYKSRNVFERNTEPSVAE